MSDYENYSLRTRYEHIVVSELLRRHFDVFINLVDDRKVNCIIRKPKEDGIHYIDVQIVALIDGSSQSHFGIFADIEIEDPNENYSVNILFNDGEHLLGHTISRFCKHIRTL